MTMLMMRMMLLTCRAVSEFMRSAGAMPRRPGPTKLKSKKSATKRERAFGCQKFLRRDKNHQRSGWYAKPG